jgi:ubiquinone/menaquinone biosynthesis C-methylase UbiE
VSLHNHFRRPSGPLGHLAGWIMARSNAVLADWGIEALQPTGDDVVLEIGAGPGVGLVKLARAGAGRVMGVEPSPVMRRLAQARIRASGMAERIELREGSAERLPVADASVDAILAVNSVHSWEDPAAGLAEARRALRPGGRFVTVLQPRWTRSADEFERAATEEYRRLAAAGFDVLPPLVKPLTPVDACLVAGSVATGVPRPTGRAPARAGCTS